ncbi:MAG: hypothetical protein ACI9JY_001488 [Saprospiraceae bacterium]|jgi:hypothetical protein
MQFFKIYKTNPPIDVVNPPADIAEMMQNACYDCHTHTTVYPWYTSVAPLSFLIRGHIRGERQHLNFSLWNDYSAKDKQHHFYEMAEVLKEKRMPMKSYVWLHSEAKMSDDEKLKLQNWFAAQSK